MLPWFAPVLAQLITLDVKDRNEARYVVALDRRYEATTRPGALLSFKWPRYDLALGYDVSFLVTPLETTPRTLVIFNGAQLDTAYRIQHTTLSLTSFASWGEVNFLTAPLQNPAPTPAGNPDNAGEPSPGDPAQPANGGTPNNGTPNNGANQPLNQTRAVNSVVRYQTSSTTLRLTQQVNRQLKLGVFTRYTMAGALDDASLSTYPRTSGTTVGVEGTFAWVFTKRDTFLTNNLNQHTWSSNGNLATSILATEIWTHRFNREVATQLGAGISMTRISQTDGLTAYSIFPDFLAGVLYQTRLGRGQFSWQSAAYSTPALDPLRATVDPQLGVRGNVAFSQDRFSTSLTGSAAISVAAEQANAGAFDSYQASFLNSFRLSDWAELDAGARVVQQNYRGGALVPFSYAGFVGLQLGYQVPLRGGTKKK